ncbi:protein of unknown function DUF302 [Malonomonas rubra DSM 5091]|uniref:DUF302 domain-containing protein n=1 Tax=Malonomonas rubra DSM 5091 TaxID=1122189 RepID=A0A1M6JD07_MALRU|nr:DUF302 domain-containing protein [Malonomonas rubra]SHJ44577.1 protein of unknown function DUF302 [Malonomonas rubra DSM 5091]
MSASIYHAETSKPVDQFIKDFAVAADKRGFLIHNEDKMEMAHTFGKHGVEVAEGFDMHMVQVCKPNKAAMTLSKNPERCVLLPKFVFVFTKDGTTAVRMLRFSAERVAELIDDAEFPNSVVESFNTIIAMIEEAL